MGKKDTRGDWEQDPRLFPLDQAGVDWEQGDIEYRSLLHETREPFTSARDRLEEWFKDYPKEQKWEFYKRFSTEDILQHVAAFWELYCFSLLRRRGYEVAVHHEVQEGSGRKPDLLASAGGKRRFFVECCTRAGPLFDEKGYLRRHFFLTRLREKLAGTSFLADIDIQEQSCNEPSTDRVFKEVLARLEGGISDEPFVVESNGWHCRIKAFLRTPERSWSHSCAPVVSCSGGEIEQSTREALGSKKPGWYGAMTIPYVIALNSFSIQVGDYLPWVLYGNDADGKGGFFGQNTSVSGVLWVFDMKPTSPEDKKPELWRNPWAKYQLTGWDDLEEPESARHRLCERTGAWTAGGST